MGLLATDIIFILIFIGLYIINVWLGDSEEVALLWSGFLTLILLLATIKNEMGKVGKGGV